MMILIMLIDINGWMLHGFSLFSAKHDIVFDLRKIALNA